jgi:hypothetical protein
MAPIFWLIVWLGNPNGAPTLLHAGNFVTMQDCLAAGVGAQYALGHPTSVPQYICVQANSAGTTPPP